jgi:hypothetical protein
MISTTCVDSNGEEFVVVAEHQGSMAVNKDEFEFMKDIPRKFNETLTDWAIRCQTIRNVRGIQNEKPADRLD